MDERQVAAIDRDKLEKRLKEDFERCLNPGRTDCPDIDIDFCWRRRDQVIRWPPLAWSTKGVIITQYDKRAVEPAGLVKIDLLSNRALSTVHNTL